MSDPACSVILCTRNRPALVARCLPALTALDHQSFEVVVVDNTGGDPAVERLAERHGARYVVEPCGGLSRARNRGGREARGALVAFTDDDALPDRAWLRHHAAALEDPDLAATSGRVLPARRQSDPIADLAIGVDDLDLGEQPFRIGRSTRDWFERTNFGGGGLGANLVFRRDLFEHGWGFPEWLGPGAGLPGEEHYALFTIVRDGGSIAYVPEAVVYHDVPATSAELHRLRARIAQGSAAYMVMLAVEEPGYRQRTLRFAWEGLRGGRRSWRTGPARAPLAGRGERILAALAGMWLYVRSRTARAPAEGCARRPVRRVLLRIGLLIRSTGIAGPAFRLDERVRARRGPRVPDVGLDGLPIPPPELQVLVTGEPSPLFEHYGRETAGALHALVGQTGDPLERLSAVLDFGVGCGRIARHWADIHGPEWHGCDANAAAVAWCAENLPFLRVTRNNPDPPLPYAAAAFDLVYAYSVFTHLAGPQQRSWMAELVRVVKPGGRLIFTTHGAAQRPQMEPGIRRRFERGEIAVRFPRHSGSNLCSAFDPPAWVRAHLLGNLELLDELHGGRPGLGEQDVYVVRRPT